jgi:hypothetical protein
MVFGVFGDYWSLMAGSDLYPRTAGIERWEYGPVRLTRTLPGFVGAKKVCTYREYISCRLSSLVNLIITILKTYPRIYHN